MNHHDFAVRGAHGLAHHYAETFDMDPVALAAEVASTLAQPFLCVDCNEYQPIIVIVGTGIKCPKDERKMYGHRVPNDVLTNILDIRENHLRDAYGAKAVTA